MSFYQQARRLMRARVYLIVAVAAIGLVMAAFGDRILERFARTCDAAPVFLDEVPTAVRERLLALHAADLLYCSAAVDGLATMSEPVYWGSDGVSSVLFFQAESLEGVGVTRYGFTSGMEGAYVPPTRGTPLVPRFREDGAGRIVYRNEAPDGSRYFVRFQGAPTVSDRVVEITISGTATPQEGLTGRDVFRDIEILMARLRGEPPASLGATAVQIPIPIQPERWIDVPRYETDARWADDEGRPDHAALVADPPDAPTPFFTVTAPLGTTVWVAGVVTGTRPTLALAPARETQAPDALEPVASARWFGLDAPIVLAHFAFEPVAAGGSYDARYRVDDADGVAPADLAWSVVIP